MILISRSIPWENETNMPQYRKNLCRKFGEEFLATATQRDKQLAPIIKLKNNVIRILRKQSAHSFTHSNVIYWLLPWNASCMTIDY